MIEQNGKFTKRFESAIDSHLFLNDIEDSWAREFIISMFHEIKHQADIIENLHNEVKRIKGRI